MAAARLVYTAYSGATADGEPSCTGFSERLLGGAVGRSSLSTLAVIDVDGGSPRPLVRVRGAPRKIRCVSAFSRAPGEHRPPAVVVAHLDPSDDERGHLPLLSLRACEPCLRASAAGCP